MAFPPAFLDELKSRLVLSDVVGRRVKLRKGPRGEFTGLCPFHNEKSPSFTVSDDKGFYHCFGCGQHGSVFDFVMNTMNLQFPEAVEQLAATAGMEVPRQSAAAAEAARRSATLHEVLDKAATWFTDQLRASQGSSARDYLKTRGVSAAGAASFRLGFAPNARTQLKDALLARDITEAQLIETGLIVKPEDGGASFDRFRNRLMFPILDSRGRVIAFGGRALGEARAKYLNSPETALFHKGRTLYGLFQARQPIREAGTAIVTEGYMDVIALVDGGFSHAVAPLGTALTEEQMGLLWRFAPEPVICLDGDAAGRRAAMAAAERALPLLKPGLSLRFAQLPEGEDPDSLIRSRGAEAMRQVLDAAVPMNELLWWKERRAQPADSPEREAGLRARLEALCREIRDPDIRDAYQRLFRARMEDEFGGPRGRQGGGRSGRDWGAKIPRPGGFRRGSSPLLRQTSLARGEESSAREGFIVGVPLVAPAVLGSGEESFASVHLADSGLDRLRGAILQASATVAGLDSETLHDQLAKQGFGEIATRLTAAVVRVNPNLRAETALEETEHAWREAMALHGRASLQREIESAWLEFAEDSSEEKRDRVASLQEELGGTQGVRTRGNLLNPA
jgi:DNA primase